MLIFVSVYLLFHFCQYFYLFFCLSITVCLMMFFIYRCSGCQSRSCFTILHTYTSSKSGLSALKLESNLGDATIGLRMVIEDTSWTCLSFIMHVHTLSNNQPSTKGWYPFIPSVTGSNWTWSLNLSSDSSTSKSILLKTFYQQEQGKINFWQILGIFCLKDAILVWVNR